jgi:tRNA-specific 2-thiouridylase
MSGGVDSTVVARLLIEQGYRVHGFFMLLPLPGLNQQISKVKLVAERLQIPLHFVDFKDRFSQSIITYFIDSYKNGLTPNPCVVCNELIKCGKLLDEMATHGMERMATGHYAQIVHTTDRAELHRAVDPAKDQSYFLCRLSNQQLDRLILPLGSWHKADVYERAAEIGFSHFDGQESQDVCFLNEKNLPDFLQERGVESSPGEIISCEDEVLGTHKGIWQYTIGQRRGLGLPDATPWYVTGLDPVNNRVIIGKNDSLFLGKLLLSDVRWAITQPQTWEGRVQLRSRHKTAQAVITSLSDNRWLVEFTEPQRAISPGQFAVFYQENRVMGSGVINTTKVTS